jgi:hypothetical protein
MSEEAGLLPSNETRHSGLAWNLSAPSNPGLPHLNYQTLIIFPFVLYLELL